MHLGQTDPGSGDVETAYWLVVGNVSRVVEGLNLPGAEMFGSRFLLYSFISAN